MTTTTPRTTYESPCGRVKVVREAPKDFALYCDGQYVKSYDYSFQAEHDAGIWLHEQAEELAHQLRDEAADRAAERAEALAGSTWTGAPARTVEDIDRAQLDAWNRMDADEQLFATVVKKWMDELPPTHQAMGRPVSS